MPFYHKLGEIPHKRHTQFRKPDGGLYREEVMGLEGIFRHRITALSSLPATPRHARRRLRRSKTRIRGIHDATASSLSAPKNFNKGAMQYRRGA